MPSPFAPAGTGALDPTNLGISPWAGVFDTITSAGLGLLQASAPGPGPKDFGTLFGGLAGGAAMGARNTEDKHLKRMMMASQLAQARSKIDAGKSIVDLMNGGSEAAGPPNPMGGAPTPLGPVASPDLGGAIAGIESGGKYDAIGPVANAQGNRAYGKYQVLDSNIGPWTQEILGKPMTPQEFIANPQAQDAVFNAKIGQYQQKYGSPQAAARAWFAGEGGMNNPNAKDVLGTSVAGYEAKVNQALGGGPAVAQGDGSGNPVQPAQYSPQGPAAAPQGQPRTMAEVATGIPPVVRQIIAAQAKSDPQGALGMMMKYADPETVPAFDPRSGQMVFVPKPALKSGQYQPVDAGNFDLAKKREARESINTKVVQGPNGPQPNPSLLDYDKSVSAAQGTDATGKMLLGDYDDVRKQNTEIQSGALTARTQLSQTNRLAQLLEQVNTGKFTGTAQEIKQTAKAFGVNLEALGVKDDTAPAEAIQALRGQMALALRNPAGGAGMPGAMSDADRNYLDKMVAGLENTPQGTKLMIEASRKIYQRQIDVARIANDFMRSPEAKKDPNALYQKLQDYADKNPLFSEKDLPQPAQPNAGSLPMPNKPPAPPAGFRIVP